MPRGILCICIDTDNKTGTIPKKVGKRFDLVGLGSKEGTTILQDPLIGSYLVRLAYEQELTLFAMKRRKDGVWVARQEDSSAEFILGKSPDIDYQRLYGAWTHFLGNRGRES